MLDVAGVEDQDVYIGIRPEGFVVDQNGPLCCELSSVEVMGRDVSIVSKHESSLNPVIRSIINSDAGLNVAGATVNYSLKSNKVFLFNKESENRLYFEVK